MSIECVVAGTPPSLKSRATRWQETIAEAMAAALPADYTPATGPVHATVIVFCDELRGDLDNRLKRIFDAMKEIVFEDDRQIETIHAHRYDASRPRDFADPSPTLIVAMAHAEDCVYLRIDERR